MESTRASKPSHADGRRKWPKKMSGLWRPWTERSTSADFDPADRGQEEGRGERKVALELALVKSPRKNVDLVSPLKPNETWEVKEVCTTAASIRPGAGGRVSVALGLKVLNGIISELSLFLDNLGDEGRLQLFLDHGMPIDEIDSWVTEAEPLFAKGEIGRGMIYPKNEGDWCLQRVLNEVARYLNSPAHQKIPLQDLQIGGKKTQINIEQYVHITMDVLAWDRKDINAGMVDIARAQFRQPIFRCPERLADGWEIMGQPSVVFADVTGVILTRKEGYLVIPKDKLDETLVFHSITKSAPRLKMRKGVY